MDLKLPAPCVVVLVGPASSGKTTWAREHFASNEVISSDALRAVVGIDEDDQAASSAAFDLLDRIVGERIRRKLTTVIDTTGLNAEDRQRWLQTSHAGGLPAFAVLFDTAAEVCEQRNAERTRSIPKSVLRKQITRYVKAATEVEDEGFDGVYTQRPMATVPPVLYEAASSEPRVEPTTSHSFGLIMSRFDWPEGDLGDQIASIARRAEIVGFRDLWVMDHFRQIPQVGRAWEDMPEAFTTLAYVAGVTATIRLGVMVSGITHRHPVVMGKMVATLDVLSGGRAICGVGAAWDGKEHVGYGIPFPALASRYDTLEDTLKMLPLLWGKGSPGFEGKTFSASELTCYPRPIQDPIPILVGGNGEKRTLRLAAEYGDAANVFGTPDLVRRKVEVLNAHCKDLDRDPDEIEMTHLMTALTATDRAGLRSRVHQMRDRNTSAEEYSAQHNAGTVDDLAALFASYSNAGADHSIVPLPDVALEGSIEAFGEVIANFVES